MLRPFVAALAVCVLLASPALAREVDPRPVSAPAASAPWVAVHRQTGLWSNDGPTARKFGDAQIGARLQIARPQHGSRLHVWDPKAENYAWINAADVGPSTRPTRESLVEPKPEAVAQPTSFIWSGTARVTMYTCVELGGCNRTASGIWPYEGVVAVDPRLIPLGSTVWVDGLGIFLAADTGSLVRGSHIDVYVTDYQRARQWGVQYLQAAAYVTR